MVFFKRQVKWVVVLKFEGDTQHGHKETILVLILNLFYFHKLSFLIM